MRQIDETNRTPDKWKRNIFRSHILVNMSHADYIKKKIFFRFEQTKKNPKVTSTMSHNITKRNDDDYDNDIDKNIEKKTTSSCAYDRVNIQMIYFEVFQTYSR